MGETHQRGGPQSPTGHGLRLPGGVPVLTPDGTMPAEALRAGDRIISRNGMLRLAAVDRLATQTRLVRIGAGTLAHGRPDEDLLLPADQPVLLRGARARLIHGAESAIVPAERLADGHLSWLEQAEVALILLRFDRPAVIYVGPLEVTTTPEPEPALT